MADFNIDEVLSQLTLSEKIGLLAGIDFWHTYPIPRLGVPSVRMSDGPNGARGTKFFDGVPGAVLPNGTAIGSTFDKELMQKAGAMIGVENKSKGAHISLGPTTNMQRGPNGGRGFESFAEDPYLAGIASSEVIKGIQSEQVAATLKHFVGNDLEFERSASDSIVTPRAMREIYLEPFRLAVKNANPKAIMTGYNKVNGEHVSQSKFYIQGVLRDEWKWEGTVMSDWFGTYTSKESVQAGLDIEMPGPPMHRTQDALASQVSTRELHIKDLDERVKSVLKLVKWASQNGIQENAAETTDNNTPETSEFLRQLAAQTIVLLKNENNLLPLKKEDKVAVIGPNAKFSAYSGGGSASLLPYYTVNPYDGVANKIGYNPPYTIGAEGFRSLPALGEQLKNPITGEKGYNLKFYQHPADYEGDREQFDEFNMVTSFHILFDYLNPKVRDNVFYGDFEGIFVPEESAEYEFGVTVYGVAQIYVNDNLVVDNKTKQRQGSFLFNSGTLEEKGRVFLEAGKAANVRIEFGSSKEFTLITPTAGVDMSGYGGIIFGARKVIDAEEEIKGAVELAKSVDKVILNIGLNSEWECEGFDRPNMELPGYTNELVSAVIAANPNTVVVNQSGTPVEFPWLKEAKAVVQAWFGGNELGNSIADVLYGDVNPSGKLPLTFPLKFEDNPTYLNFRTERGRVLYGEDIFVGYRYYEKLQKQVAFPFGYGLSYTTFAFSDLKVSVNEDKDELTFSAKVKNTGSIAGKQVAQFYVSKTETDVIRPVKELKAFEKVELQPGEEKTVESIVSLKDSVSFFDEYQNQWSQQAGEYNVHLGASSDDIEFSETFNVTKSRFWSGL